MSQTDTGAAGSVREKLDVNEPELVDVILLNDDFTPMDFVVEVLTSIYHHSKPDAERLMLTVHHNGSAVAGTYTHDIARTKAMVTRHLARDAGYPLRVQLRPH